MDTIPSLAQEMSRAFVKSKRDSGEEFVKLRDESPDWMTDIVHAAHEDGSIGGMLPDDWRYRFVEDAVDALAEMDENNDPNDAELREYILTHDQTGWLHSHLTRHGYVDQAMEEYGSAFDFTTLLVMGMQQEQREVLSKVIGALENLVGEGDEEATA